MPRKTSKIDKPPLLFLERPVGGARLQNVPEVRAALNPKGFFTEAQARHSSALDSWVSPQFDSSLAAAPVRRGRRNRRAVTSILDSCSQLSRRTSVCKYPSLSFESRSRNQSHQAKHTLRKTNTESAGAPSATNQPVGSCRVENAVSSARCLDTPKRQSTSIRAKNGRTVSDGAATAGGCLDEPSPPNRVAGKRRAPALGASTPASGELRTADVSSVCAPPDVDTPKAIQEGRTCPPSPSRHWLLAQPRTPPCNPLADMLVADTPERDYGLKVTWRRRMGLMMTLKERGYLSDSDVLVRS